MLNRIDAPAWDDPATRPAFARRRGALPCSGATCASTTAVRCEYVDRRGHECATAWCFVHQQVAFAGVYCRRHAGIVRALGADWRQMLLPDLENRAPSLANWVGMELNEPVRNLLERFFGHHRINVTTVVGGGPSATRTWGRIWRLITPDGADHSVGVAVPESDDGVVRLSYQARVILEMVPPWIEARRHGVVLDRQVDAEARRRFYGLLLEDLEAAMRGLTKPG